MTDIFVFGSNLSGIHGAGAAAFALQKRGAVWGVGDGPTGQAYAIPTKNHVLETMSLSEIAPYVRRFIKYAEAHPELTFHVTPIGTGLAGYKHEDISPLFAAVPTNCKMPVEWGGTAGMLRE